MALPLEPLTRTPQEQDTLHPPLNSQVSHLPHPTVLHPPSFPREHPHLLPRRPTLPSNNATSDLLLLSNNPPNPRPTPTSNSSSTSTATRSTPPQSRTTAKEDREDTSTTQLPPPTTPLDQHRRSTGMEEEETSSSLECLPRWEHP